jgi:hypothetical protein
VVGGRRGNRGEGGSKRGQVAGVERSEVSKRVDFAAYNQSAEYFQAQKQDVYRVIILREESEGGADGLPVRVGVDPLVF